MYAPITRPCVGVGVALLGAGLLGAASVSAPPPQVAPPDVELSAVFDPITPWLDALGHTTANAGALVDVWGLAPLPIGQQFAVNQLSYLDQLLTNPLALGNVGLQVLGNLNESLTAPFRTVILDSIVNPSPPPLIGVTAAALLGFNHTLFTSAFNYANAFDTQWASLLDFSASPASGLLLGAAGPVLSPLLALADQIQSAITGLGLLDPVGALNDLVNIPARMTDAFLNGGEYLDLTALLGPLVGPIPGWPAGLPVGVELGGLLSGPGSLFSALHTPTASFLTGLGVGPIGALVGLGQALGVTLGWDPIALGLGMPLDVFASGPLDLGLPGVLGNLVDIPGLLLNGLLWALF